MTNGEEGGDPSAAAAPQQQHINREQLNFADTFNLHFIVIAEEEKNEKQRVLIN